MSGREVLLGAGNSVRSQSGRSPALRAAQQPVPQLETGDIGRLRAADGPGTGLEADRGAKSVSRRRETSQQAVGDDSFLDIVANIVGILIILIVVAGVRASRAPVELLEVVNGPDEPDPPPTEVVAPSLESRFRATAPAIVDRTDEVTRLADQSEEIRDRLGETLGSLSAVRRRTSSRREEVKRVRKQQVDRRPDVDAGHADQHQHL